MTVAVPISHDQAMQVAVDRLDGFPVTPIESVSTDSHLLTCPSCREVFEAIKEDSEDLSSWKWDESNPDGYEDDDDWGDEWPDQDRSRSQTVESDEDEDEEGDGDSAGDSESDEDGDASGEGSYELSDEGESEASDDEDLEEVGDLARPGQPDEESDDETPDKVVASEGQTDEEDDEEEDDELEAAAKAAADALSDSELGDLEEDGEDVLPSCASEGVDEAAREAGVQTTDQQRKDAERTIRAQDGVEKTKYGRVAISRSTRGVTRNTGNGDPEQSGAAASAIRNAVLRSRGGHSAVSRHQCRGRIDNKSLVRIAERDTRLFKRTSAPSPTPLLVWVLVDVSGSMSYKPIQDAAAVARALADASAGTPSMRLAVWAWSDPFTKEQARFAGAVAGVVRVWETGMPTSEVFKLTRLPMGGTPDAPVLEWAWRAIRRETHGEERPVIIMCSDGFGYGGLDKIVVEAAAHGVETRSVAIGNISERTQLAVYGRGKYIPWQGSIVATARPLATMLTALTMPK